MKTKLAGYGFPATLAAGVIGIALLTPAPVGYINLFLLVLFGSVLYATRTWHDRAFYLVCAGEPLVIGCGAVNIWAGLFVVWMLAGIVCPAMGITVSVSEKIPFLLFCCATFFIAVIIQLSNHVLFPLILLCAGTGLIITVKAVRDYQLKKQYSGEPV
jgi:hypothetical protein